MDCIQINEIRAYGYAGALPEEQVLGQWFEVNLTLWFDLSRSGQSDRLQDTLDYCDVIEGVQQIIRASRFTLLERMATVIAELVLGFDLVDQVRVNLVKLAAPIPDFGGKIAIDITRKKVA
ncbi:dihydroneopterin aldolase [Phormidesmis sp. 146-12]